MTPVTSPKPLLALTATWLLVPVLAIAHVGQGDIGGGFLSGLAHPVMRLDHVIAMIAVGMWGAQLGAPAIWLLPVTFPVVMAFGGVLGAIGVPIPGIEAGIALSAIALGAMVAFAARPQCGSPPRWSASLRSFTAMLTALSCRSQPTRSPIP